MNPFCKNPNIYALQKISDFFPHKTCEFATMLFNNKKNNQDIPELIIAYEFISQNGFILRDEKHNDI